MESHLVQSANRWCILYKTFSFLHVAIVVLYRLWNLELGESPYASSLRADSERIQWEFVGASRRERQDKWKGERGAHQATGQAIVQGCPGGEKPRHLYQWREISERETAAYAASRIPPGRVESQAAWSKTDRTTGRRIARSHFEVPKTPRGSGNCQSGSRSHYHQRDSGHCELPSSTCGTRATPCFICGVSQGRWTGQRDASVACKHSIINRRTRAGEQQYRQRRSCSIPSRTANPNTSTIPPDTQRSGTMDITVDMCDVSNRGSKHTGSADWPQNTNKVRLTTKTMTEETPQLEEQPKHTCLMQEV